ncbi:lipid kinase YegS [Vibrio sp. ZSDZ34]|uniref:Lipid kinase YegS n=1 Tax=Vibrio gelatinilyticus TaxID=2893468 RepID=A0A9X2AYH2_9VIBR|nr:lipid kinase YegS [Vibrio gelatinilyticus]MCJ2376648.1 lipid kinase YegS [Vibrio gelatinilyticus]
MKTRLLLNGKKASQESIRQAVHCLRDEGFDLEVRTTWEAGDIARLVTEASQEHCQRVIAGGGDGTVNEVVDAIMQTGQQDIDIAILPLGTANDFATACSIPTQSPYDALKLALNGQAHPVDCVKANSRYFINIAAAGFGAQVTANTPFALKNFLGGGAYTLSGLVQAINFRPFEGDAFYDGLQVASRVVIGAICNGRMAGGGQQLSPRALINDGLIEVVSLEEFEPSDIPQVIDELMQEEHFTGQFVKRNQVKSIRWQSKDVMPINLDGEPIQTRDITFTVMPSAIKLVLPNSCGILGAGRFEKRRLYVAFKLLSLTF